MIINTNKTKYILNKEMAFIYPEDISECIKTDIGLPDNSSLSVERRVSEEIAAEITDEEIDRSLANCKSLVLQLTQDCNLRCKYCSYNGKYKSKRTHNNKKMDLNSAKKAVDLFLNHISTSIYRTSRQPVIISFYGGEALLEYVTLQEIIRYINEKNKISSQNIKFLLTTNGLSLKPGIVDQLVKNDFTIEISLDGPEEEHDKFRISIGGSGTHKRIMENIIYIKDTYPEFYKKKVNFMVTRHPEHDLKKVERFFLEQPELFNNINVLVNSVNLTPDLEDSERTRLLNKVARLKDRIESQLDKNKWFYQLLTLNPIDDKLSYGVRFLKGSTVNSFTGTCLPASVKVMADVDGNLHMCERISLDYPIGNVESGFDYNKIRVLIRNWRQQILARKCWECGVLYFCNFCFATQSTEEQIEISEKACLDLKNSLIGRLNRYLTFKEIEDEKNYSAVSNINQFLDLL